jgi:hypothetical protein
LIEPEDIWTPQSFAWNYRWQFLQQAIGATLNTQRMAPHR